VSPRLVAVSGPLAGRTFELGGAEPLTLGRHSSSSVQIHDIAVSRQHCSLELAEDRVRLRDLDSRHGTFVNGLPVHDRLLEPGDLITVGSSVFLFAAGRPGDLAGPAGPAGEVPETAAEPWLDDSDFLARSTVHLPLQAARYLQAQTAPAASRLARELHALVQAGCRLGTLRETLPLARRLADLALEALPAERGAVLLLDSGTGEPADGVFCAAEPGGLPAEVEPFPVSRTVVQRTLAERTALLANGVLRSAGDLAGAASLQAQRIQSLLCAPLIGLERPLGVLYLDSRAAGASFDEEHLQLLTALAGIGAAALDNVRRIEWLEAENRRLEAASGGDLVGESPRLLEIGRLIARIAPTDSTVLLRGESGTGKEVAARAIHRASRRAGRPFVAINCATLSETLLESELFGHERGAFTGAVARKTGKLEVADSGTLFLDEVGELPPSLQAKLLRVLQEREFERLGGVRPIRVDVRVIAATNRDLEKAIREGAFRQDLYYRLNVITLEMPPLRDRPGDIPLLASHFAVRLARKLGRPLAGFTPEARACLERYAWPGNVRELANAVERAVVLGEGEMIRPEDLPETVLEAAPGAAGGSPVPRFHESVAAHKRRLILDAVAQAGGNVSRAAERLGLHPNYLHRLITNLELRERLPG
jgi:transcriptional regulator with GAF, ATPase, and Fis domain